MFSPWVGTKVEGPSAGLAPEPDEETGSVLSEPSPAEASAGVALGGEPEGSHSIVVDSALCMPGSDST